AGLLTCAVIGPLVHLPAMRHLPRAPPLAPTAATLAWPFVAQPTPAPRSGAKITFVTSELPTNLLTFWGITISVDRFILLGIAAVLSAALWAFYRFTKFGLATS